MAEVGLFCREIVNIPVDQVVSWQGGHCRNSVLAAGLDPFDKPVHSTPHFQALQAVDQQNRDPQDLDYVRYYDALIAAGFAKRNSGEILTSGRERLQVFYELYREIQSSQVLEPVLVEAKSNGSFLCLDGQHRAAIAAKLGCKTLPGRIKAVDAPLRELLRSLYIDWPPRTRTLYQPIEHPAFDDWTVVRSESRWKRIRDAFDWPRAKVLDIGSYTGHISREASKCGACVVGVDADSHRVDIARRLDALLGTHVEYVCGDYLPVLGKHHWDAVVSLSVFHWILRKRGVPGLWKCIEEIAQASDILIAEFATRAEPKMQKPEWNRGLDLSVESIPHLVVENTSLR
jgi:plasmid stabilization system protein ParE